MKTKLVYIFSVILLVLSIASFVEATTYYVDSNTGLDSNNGLTTSSPWKSLNKVNTYSQAPGFQPGDSILFNRGSIWFEELYFKSSGNSNNKIILGAYGSGAMPLFTGRSELTNWSNTSSWTEVSPNTWLFSTTQHIKRLRLNGLEYEFTKNYEDITETVRWSYNMTTLSKLYVYSIGNPATTYTNMTVISDSSFPAVLYLQGINNIIVENINITGGYQESIYLTYSNNITLRNVATGYDSHQGIACRGSGNPKYLMSSDNLIDNVIIDSGYKLNNKDDDGNVEDGVNLGCGCYHWTIQNSQFLDWAHSALYPLCQSTDYTIGASYNTFKNNYFDNSHLTYGRAYNVDGYEGMAQYNNFSNNTIKDTWATNQMNGDHNIFEYNIVDTMTNSPSKTAETGIGLQIVVYGANLVAHDNIVDHNTFMNLDGPGVQIHWYALGPTYNNVVSNNIFINNGKIGKSDNEQNISMFVYNNAQVYNNVFKNNVVYQSNNNKNVARYRNTNMNESKFITTSLNNGDTASNTKWMNPQLDSNYIPQNPDICTFQDGVNFVGAKPCSYTPPVNNTPIVNESVNNTSPVNNTPVVNDTINDTENNTPIVNNTIDDTQNQTQNQSPVVQSPANISIYLTQVNQRLTCNYDVAGDNIELHVLWFKNNVEIAEDINNITGSAGSWYCLVNVTSHNQSQSSNVITIANTIINGVVSTTGAGAGGGAGSLDGTPITTTSPSNIINHDNKNTLVKTDTSEGNNAISDNNNQADSSTTPVVEQPERIISLPEKIIPYFMILIFITALVLLIVNKKHNVSDKIPVQRNFSIGINPVPLKEKIFMNIDSGHLNKSNLSTYVLNYLGQGLLNRTEVSEIYQYFKKKGVY